MELAARGTLNQVPCKMIFSSGCPDVIFSGLELYKCTFHLTLYYGQNTEKFDITAEIIIKIGISYIIDR